MGRVALISDIHGSGVALETVLAELARDRVDEIVCVGDIAAGGPQPREVPARLRELGCRDFRMHEIKVEARRSAERRNLAAANGV
jgi:hypothetical protein